MNIKAVVSAFFALCFLIVATPSYAQEVVPISVGVVDVPRVVQVSAAGKDIQKQLDKKRAEYQKQISSKESGLRAAEKAILDQRADMSKEEFLKKRQGFEKDVIAAQKLVQKNKSVLDAGFGHAMAKLREEVRKTIAEVAAERGYAMVVSQASVIIAAKDMDITDEVVERLNARVKKIKIDWSGK